MNGERESGRYPECESVYNRTYTNHLEGLMAFGVVYRGGGRTVRRELKQDERRNGRRRRRRKQSENEDERAVRSQEGRERSE